MWHLRKLNSIDILTKVADIFGKSSLLLLPECSRQNLGPLRKAKLLVGYNGLHVKSH